MSGGSMDYAYHHVENVEFPQDTPERRAFASYLKLVARALHDIEWVDSADYAPGDENAAIRACLPGGMILAQAREDARRAIRDDGARLRAERAR